MPIIISGVHTALDEGEQEAIRKAVRLLGIPKSQVKEAQIAKVSLDARKQDRISAVHSVRITLYDGEQEAAAAAAKRLGENFVKYWEDQPLIFEKGTKKADAPVAVAGFGPAGMFAALVLAEQGYCPLVLERGPEMDRRVKAVQSFWNGGTFSEHANVQFGEGGAGTFSDGKLTTRISDSRCDYVLRRFVEFGAPPEILVKAKPHIGTDLLRGVVKNLREQILSLGGRILFDTQVTGLSWKEGKLNGVSTNQGDFAVSSLILAVGHSARDTFSMLAKQGVLAEAKPFSVGVRIEHLQSEIDKGLYGKFAGHPRLPKGEYQLSWRRGDRGVYTFCMCPGGIVIPSCSESDTIVTNGMSEFARDGKNANSAVVVSVTPNDFGTGILDGIAFQRELEQRAFTLGKGQYRAPAQDLGSFLAGKMGLHLKRVEPTYANGVTGASFHQLFPDFITDMLETGLIKFGKRLPGFDASDAVLTGPETRTSSPIRILRKENCESVSHKGLYPCGEGAGYAGGIMSAAVDGIRVAQEVMKQFIP